MANTVYQEVTEYLVEIVKSTGHGSQVRKACSAFAKRKDYPGTPKTQRTQSVPKKWTADAFEKQNGLCPICNQEMLLSEAEGDHIQPLLKGGEHNKRNIQAVHGKNAVLRGLKNCNAEKGSKDQTEYSKYRQTR